MRKFSLTRTMEFTRLNPSIESDSSDGGWHMLIGPRSAENHFDQQDLLEGEFCKSLPRAHFLRPGSFHAAAERGAFSPDRHDLCFKGEWLQDQCSWDSKSSASLAHSCSPHPLAQPGFYSPKIPRSRHFEPTTEYHAHTLPLSHTKLAVFKQSTLSCRPQGIKTSVVEKPRLMRAAISPMLPHSTPINPNQQQTNDHKIQPGKKQEIQTQRFSSLRQCTLNSTSTEISESQSRGRGTQINSEQTNRQESYEAGNYSIDNRNNGAVDTKLKNVFGQPRIIATLRSGCTTRPVRNTTVVEDLKKLILMDDVTDSITQTSCATECPQGLSSPKPLTFCSSVRTRHPVRSPNRLFLQSDPPMCQPQCGLSDTLVWDQDDQFKENPPNLTGTACKLDWDSLDNSEAYETQEMVNLLAGESSDMQSGTSPESHSQHLHHALNKASDDNVFNDVPDHLSHLEAMLMKLSTDLLKEKKDKVALLAEVLKLRMSNQHLKEESLSAHAQLHKICQMFSLNPESVE